MLKQILIFFLLFLSKKAEAQNHWIDYLKEIKTHFSFKDTIIVKFQNGFRPDSTIKPVKVNSDYKSIFKSNEDTLTEEGGARSDKYFYSFYLSKNNYATLVLYSRGRWRETGNLYLYNFSPEGKLLTQIKLQEGWGDAGESYLGSSTFANDSILNVISAIGFEKPDQSYHYHITEWNYLLNNNGQFVQKSVQQYDKNAEQLDYKNREFR